MEVELKGSYIAPVSKKYEAEAILKYQPEEPHPPSTAEYESITALEIDCPPASPQPPPPPPPSYGYLPAPPFKKNICKKEDMKCNEKGEQEKVLEEKPDPVSVAPDADIEEKAKKLQADNA